VIAIETGLTCGIGLRCQTIACVVGVVFLFFRENSRASQLVDAEIVCFQRSTHLFYHTKKKSPRKV
ncbi:hypothetical protein, partial [Streptococcus suis]|uniref:hypothetical protein n=1 Tax=Streptococcus suis TaxID=1307 RepID=UPI001E5991F9